MGINTALRISDLLQLQMGQFLDDRGRYRRRFWIHEQRRNKRHEVAINQSIREALIEHLKDYPGVAEDSEILCYSTPRRMATLIPSNEDRPGSSSFQSATRWDCQAASAHTV